MDLGSGYPWNAGRRGQKAVGAFIGARGKRYPGGGCDPRISRRKDLTGNGAGGAETPPHPKKDPFSQQRGNHVGVKNERLIGSMGKGRLPVPFQTSSKKDRKAG